MALHKPGYFCWELGNTYYFSFAKLVVTVTPSGNDFHSRIVYMLCYRLASLPRAVLPHRVSRGCHSSQQQKEAPHHWKEIFLSSQVANAAHLLPSVSEKALWGRVPRLCLLFGFFILSYFNLLSEGCQDWTRTDASVLLQAERECLLWNCNTIPVPGIACGYLHQAQALGISKWKCSWSRQGLDIALCMYCKHMTAWRNSTSAVSSRECFKVLQYTKMYLFSINPNLHSVLYGLYRKIYTIAFTFCRVLCLLQ